MKKAVFNKSLIVGSGMTASPGTVLTAGRSYTLAVRPLLLALRPVVCHRSSVPVSYQVETGTKASRRSIIGGWNRCLFPVFGLTHEHRVILSQG